MKFGEVSWAMVLDFILLRFDSSSFIRDIINYAGCSRGTGINKGTLEEAPQTPLDNQLAAAPIASNNVVTGAKGVIGVII
jgi:hypothetical protein